MELTTLRDGTPARVAACAALALTVLVTGAAAADARCLNRGELVVADPEAYGGGGGLTGVERPSGDRREISSNARGVGPAFVDPYNLTTDVHTLDPESRCTTLLVADRGAPGGTDGRVLRVDPDTGNRSVVSAVGGPGAGVDLVDPTGIAVESTGQILVTDLNAFGGGGGVIRVDPSSGDRTQVAANTAGGAASFIEPSDLGIEDSSHVLVADRDAGAFGALLRVDTSTTNSFTQVSDAANPPDPPGGPGWQNPNGLNRFLGRNVFLVDKGAPATPGALFDVDAGSGNRAFVSHNVSRGVGQPFVEPADTTAGPTNSMTDPVLFGTGAVIDVTGSSGDRTLLSANAGPGSGANFQEPWGIIRIGAAAVNAQTAPAAFRVSGATRITYEMTHAVPVEFTVERRVAGRVSGNRCRRSARTGRRCTIFTEVGGFTRSSTRGTNRVRWSGRVAGKELQPGSYQLVLTPKDPRAREETDAVAIRFRVLRG